MSNNSTKWFTNSLNIFVLTIRQIEQAAADWRRGF